MLDWSVLVKSAHIGDFRNLLLTALYHMRADTILDGTLIEPPNQINIQFKIQPNIYLFDYYRLLCEKNDCIFAKRTEFCVALNGNVWYNA